VRIASVTILRYNHYDFNRTIIKTYRFAVDLQLRFAIFANITLACLRHYVIRRSVRFAAGLVTGRPTDLVAFHRRHLRNSSIGFGDRDGQRFGIVGGVLVRRRRRTVGRAQSPAEDQRGAGGRKTGATTVQQAAVHQKRVPRVQGVLA